MPQTIWAGAKEPVYRCGNWPECKVLGLKVVMNRIVVNSTISSQTVPEGPSSSTAQAHPKQTQQFDLTAADQMFAMQQQVVALQQQIMNQTPAVARTPAQRRRKAASGPDEVMIIDSGSEI